MVDRVRSATNRCAVDMRIPRSVRAKLNHPTTRTQGLLSYGEVLARRMWSKLPKKKQIHYYPSATKPDTYKTSMESIPYPRSLPKNLFYYADNNSDNILDPSERMNLWEVVRNGYTHLRLLKALRNSGCNSNLLRRTIKKLETELKGLKTLYMHLPHINLQTGATSIYGRTIKIRLGSGVHPNPLPLFHFADALMIIPYHVFKRLNIFQVKYTLQHDALYAGVFYQPDGITYQTDQIIYSFIVLHEIGHYVDYQLARRLGHEVTYLTSSEPFYGEWKRRFHLALPRKKDRDLFYRLGDITLSKKQQKQWKRLTKQLKKYFLDDYSANDPRERFAEAWVAYWLRDRAKVKKYTPDLYRLFEKIRKGQSLAEYRYKKKRIPQPPGPRIGVYTELSLTGNSSVMRSQMSNTDRVMLSSVSAALRIYHVGGLLFAKAAGGYTRMAIKDTANNSSDEKHFMSFSLGYGIHLGHNLKGLFRGASIEASAGFFLPGFKPFFNSEIHFPKLRFLLNKKKNIFLYVNPTVGVNVFGGSNKRVVASPYVGASVAITFDYNDY